VTIHTIVRIEYPEWVDGIVDWEGERSYHSDEEKMRLAITLARENVTRASGGPFGAAIFEGPTGRVVAVGTNSVLRYNLSALHGVMVAFMMAQQRTGSYTLHGPGLPPHELFTSCEPCAMCLGAALGSGVRRIVCAAAREDATRIGFDEGPVFPESYAYLEARGISISRNVLRDDARAVIELYRARGGPVYNG
jgi:tRNA(Arg) A34 adenosine deaminase TadA